jgi:hypothetical protein
VCLFFAQLIRKSRKRYSCVHLKEHWCVGGSGREGGGVRGNKARA